MKRKIRYLLLVFLSWFLIHEVFIITDGLNDEKGQSAIAVIFGNTVHKDGSLSDRLKARLDRGIVLYNARQVKQIVVSGGLGKEGHYEGTKMAEYLVGKGIAPTAIFIDNEGNNSQQTASNFVRDHPHKKSVTVISQFYHISRAKLAFRNVGMADVKGAHCDFFELRDVYALGREFFGYYKYLFMKNGKPEDRSPK